ncbi:MAG: response regulator transcription factor [Kofleriaceae bacterium]
MGDSRACLIRSLIVIDDDERLLVAFRRALRDEGRLVLTASDPIMGRRICQDQRPDLAIVDLRLSESSGLDLIRDLRQDRDDLKIALVSGWLSISTALAAVYAGAHAFFSKPVSPGEIVAYFEHGPGHAPEAHRTPSLARVEYEHIQRVLADAHGNVAEAARRLRMHRQSLHRKLKKLAP